ncbi:Ger(x)C family spore germination protein [Mobilitalea sibirica]|uniref:Ger(X)C family spore germination protein n=1 Tax=Mobilitalea sibirica TaxID=1462919 RepID=A0A8J7L013_9FIRM|nr:Ger(x)C family spore germination protein [Mobilitalea sibirica]MBH1941388.1 Ger(x)C family spore germination protein [Mobilitalea sibirica]
MNKIFLLLFPLLLCGCSHDMNRREIDEINIVLVLGIDYTEDEYTLSALYKTGGGADPEQGGSADQEEIAEGSGKTPYAALEDLKLKNKKTITLAQTGSFLIGDSAAKNGIDTCLDFLSRDETIKMESLIFVTKSIDAKTFIKKGMEAKQKIHEDLEAIKQKQNEMFTRLDNTLVNLLNEMKQTSSSILIPYLISDESSFLIEGYTVLDQMKLKDYLDKETSTGVDFIRNIIRRHPIFLEEGVGLELSYTSTDLKTHLNDKEVTVIINHDFETMIKEVTTEEDIFTRKGLDKLTQAQNEYIVKLLKKATDYSVNSGSDILQIARLVEYNHVREWKDMEKDWVEIIPDIEYQYVLNSKIDKSFILGNVR